MPEFCNVPDCARLVLARGLCRRHYDQGRRSHTFTVAWATRPPRESGGHQTPTPEHYDRTEHYDPTEWRHAAACKGQPLDLFFPERGESTREIKAFCDRCTVQAECLNYALDHHIKHGIWGGRSERERRRLRRTRSAA